MRPELRPLVRPLALRPSRGSELFEGSFAGLEVVAAITGIGMRPAAQAAQRVLDSGAVDHLLVVGIAGGIARSLSIGDVVIPERVIDLATRREYRPAPLGEGAPRGALATSDELIVDAERFAALERQGVVAIDMETAAIAEVCERRGRPWSVWRAISDRVGDAAIDAELLRLAGSDGSLDLPALLRFLARRPGRVPDLVRLGRQMTRATRAAATAAVAALGSAAAAGRSC
jgi:adenosylhomocysteine nucleosidase